MAKQLHIFNDTFLIKFARKRSGPHTKITKQNFTPVRIQNNEWNYFTEFSTIKNQNHFTEIFNASKMDNFS
jgi:hypothetical protein